MYTKEYFAPKSDLTDAFWVRDQVFTREQGFSPDIEIDATDPLAHHVVFYKEGKPFATARTFSKEIESKESSDTYIYMVGRVAILKEYRKAGTGKDLMDTIEAVALGQGAKAFALGAQCSASGFYEKCGYVKTDHTYFEEYCEHVTMVKSVG